MTPPSLSLKPTAAPPPPLSPSEARGRGSWCGGLRATPPLTAAAREQAEGGYLCDRLPPPVAIDYSTPLIEELKERRKAIRNKACHNELDLDVIVEHWKWFQEQSDKLDVQCHDLSARSKRLLIRHRRGTAYSNQAGGEGVEGHGQDTSGTRPRHAPQVAGLEKEREDYNANIRALRADKEWIEGTSAWRRDAAEMRPRCGRDVASWWLMRTSEWTDQAHHQADSRAHRHHQVGRGDATLDHPRGTETARDADLGKRASRTVAARGREQRLVTAGVAERCLRPRSCGRTRRSSAPLRSTSSATACAEGGVRRAPRRRGGDDGTWHFSGHRSDSRVRPSALGSSG